MKKNNTFSPIYLFINNKSSDFNLPEIFQQTNTLDYIWNKIFTDQKKIFNPLRLFLPEKINVRLHYPNECKKKNLSNDKCVLNIHMKDIAYITSQKKIFGSNTFTLKRNYQAVVTTDNKIFLLKHKSLSELNDRLPYYFVQINQSTIINLLNCKGKIGKTVFVGNYEFDINNTYMNHFLMKSKLFLISYS
jgi:hypothetical protein